MLRKGFMHRLLALVNLVLALLLGCGGQTAATQSAGKAKPGAGALKYKLDFEYTEDKENALRFKGLGDDLFVTFEGEGFSMDLPLGSKMPVPEDVLFRFEDYRDYVCKMTIYQSDGTIYLTDLLIWTRSDAVPNTPVIGFNETATNDPYVKLVLIPNLDAITNQVWIEGDLTGATPGAGQWYDINPTLRYSLTLTPNEGRKEIRVKVRNKFLAESAMVSSSIVYNSTTPKPCRSEPVALRTPSTFVKFKVAAEDDFHTYYRVIGETKNTDRFIEFKSSQIFNVELDIEDRMKPVKKIIKVQIKDRAENFCPMMIHEVEYDPTYVSGEIKTSGDILWTDNEDVEVHLKYDHFNDEPVEMYIDGAIEDDENTFSWVAFKETFTVSLKPHSGHRFIYAKFRDSFSTQARGQYVGVYLRPFLYVMGTATTGYSVSMANIPGMTGITIRGCQEEYNNIPFQTRVPCKPTGTSVEATYHMQDGNDATRSALVRQ